MPKRSRYAGEAIDVSSRHSIAIHPREDGRALIDPDDRHVVVDYFYHEGVYRKAVIPLDGVDHVFGQAFNFSKPKVKKGENGPEIVFGRDGLPRRRWRILNHVQSRFTLKPECPIELYAMEGDSTDVPTHRLHDFVYSVEAVGPMGVRFGVRDGLTGSLISAHRFLSTQEMVFERIVVENQYVTESPSLPLRDAEKRAVLTESLLRSHRAGMSETYYLFRVCGTNNCTSNPLQIVDQVVPYGLAHRIGSALYRLPFDPRFYLRVRGLDSDPSVRKLVRDEFEQYIGDPKTQERKREYVRSRRHAVRAAREARKGHRAPPTGPGGP